jgi:hypothetical protein
MIAIYNQKDTEIASAYFRSKVIIVFSKKTAKVLRGRMDSW